MMTEKVKTPEQWISEEATVYSSTYNGRNKKSEKYIYDQDLKDNMQSRPVNKLSDSSFTLTSLKGNF